MNIHPWLHDKMRSHGLIVKVVREEVYPLSGNYVEKITVTFRSRDNEELVNGKIFVFEQTFSVQAPDPYVRGSKTYFLPEGEKKYLWIEDPQ